MVLFRHHPSRLRQRGLLYIRYWPFRERHAFARNLRGPLLAHARESEGILMTGTKRRAEKARESFPTWTNYLHSTMLLLLQYLPTTYVIAGRGISINVFDKRATASTHCTLALRRLLVPSMLYPVWGPLHRIACSGCSSTKGCQAAHPT